MYKPSDGAGAPSSASSAAAAVEPISYTTHKMLHTFTGAALGALSAVATGQDVGLSAASGGFGGLVGSVMTEAMIDEKDTFAKAQRISQMSDFLTATLALGIGLDPTMAHLAAHNASEHNELKHHRSYLESVGVIGAEVAEAEELYEILGSKEDLTPAQQAEIRKVLNANPKLAQTLLMQKYAQAQLLEANRLEHLGGKLGQATYAGRLSFDGLNVEGLQSPRERAQSLRLSAYRVITSANDYLNSFAQANPALAHYAVKGLEFGATVLHASAYVGAAVTGGPAGVATLFAIEQAVGKSLEAAIEISAEHAAQSATSPAEAERLRRGVYEMCGKGAMLAGVFGIGKLVKGQKSSGASGSGGSGAGSGKSAPGMVSSAGVGTGAGAPASAGFTSAAPRAAPKVKKAAEAEDALAKFAKQKTSEQPWTVRPGQEWKDKIFGKAQVTGGIDKVAGQAHAFRSYREAIIAAKREDVAAVFLNRGVRKATGHPIAAPNTRPDVTIRRADGRIDQVEVRSRTDEVRVLRARMDATESRLPHSMQGGEKILKEFTTEVSK